MACLLDHGLQLLAGMERHHAARAGPDLLEKRLDHVFGLAFVQADLLKQQVGQFGLRQRHRPLPESLSYLSSLLFTETCGEFRPQQGYQRIAGSVRLRIREGSFSILHNYPESKAFCPWREVRPLVQVE